MCKHSQSRVIMNRDMMSDPPTPEELSSYYSYLISTYITPWMLHNERVGMVDLLEGRICKKMREMSHISE